MHSPANTIPSLPHLSPKLPNNMLFEIVTRVRDDLPTLDALIATDDRELGELARLARAGNVPHFREAYLVPLLESLEAAGSATPDFHRDNFIRLRKIDDELLMVAFGMSGSPVKETHTLDIDLLPAEFEWAAARAVEFGLEPSALAGRGRLTVSCLAWENVRVAHGLGGPCWPRAGVGFGAVHGASDQAVACAAGGAQQWALAGHQRCLSANLKLHIQCMIENGAREPAAVHCGRCW